MGNLRSIRRKMADRAVRNLGMPRNAKYHDGKGHFTVPKTAQDRDTFTNTVIKASDGTKYAVMANGSRVKIGGDIGKLTPQQREAIILNKIKEAAGL